MLSYVDLLANKAKVGEDVIVIGAGGIGFDVAEHLTHNGKYGETPDEFIARGRRQDIIVSRRPLDAKEEWKPKRKVKLCSVKVANMAED